MQLFVKFQGHPERFYADNSIQVYDRSQRKEEVSRKLKTLQKKRVKKNGRKEVEKQKDLYETASDAGKQVCKLIVYGVGVYTL